MAKVITVKKSQKDYPAFGIKKGDTYYQWKFRFGGVKKSLTYPTRQQLTQSDFLICLYDLEDQQSALEATEALPDDVQELIDAIQSLRDEQEEKRSNMPEGLQEGDVGNLLQERYDGLDEWASELERIDFDIEDDEYLLGEIKDNFDETETKWEDLKQETKDELLAEKKQEFWDEKLEEIQGISHSL